ncbi:MAG: diaminopimelate epimerase [Nanoarchaeota archaeon]
MVEISKMQALGNRLILVDEYASLVIPENAKSDFVRVVAKDNFDPDSVLFVSKLNGIMKMRIFDRDGTEETMCGNGIRCVALYGMKRGYVTGKKFEINTLDGVKQITFKGDNLFEVNMGVSRSFKRVDKNLYFVFTGIPHLVEFVNSLEKINAYKRCVALRYNRPICERLGYPDNMHVNMIEVLNPHKVKIKTYEACVERITECCGTGATATAYVVNRVNSCKFPIEVISLGGSLHFDLNGKNILMTGPAEYLTKEEFDYDCI